MYCSVTIHGKHWSIKIAGRCIINLHPVLMGLWSSVMSIVENLHFQEVWNHGLWTGFNSRENTLLSITSNVISPHIQSFFPVQWQKVIYKWVTRCHSRTMDKASRLSWRVLQLRLFTTRVGRSSHKRVLSQILPRMKAGILLETVCSIFWSKWSCERVSSFAFTISV